MTQLLPQAPSMAPARLHHATPPATRGGALATRGGALATRTGALATCARAVLLILAAAAATPVAAQEVRVRDLATPDSEVPVRLVGYGLVVGLDGSGDRAIGRYGAGQTVQSIVNLLRNFGVNVPADMLRTRNVAAVLVTAEASPYLRTGGRFDVQVASIGDATSLRGGMLWTTPLVSELGGDVLATVQGALLMSDGRAPRGVGGVETSARMPGGGMLVGPLPASGFAGATRLVLRHPDLSTAARIAAAINTSVGAGTAQVEDPGAIALTIPDGPERAQFLVGIGDLLVNPDRAAQIVIDSRDGTIAAGGDVRVGPAVVSHGLLTLSVGGTPGATGVPGDVRVPAGASVQDVAGALHAIAAAPSAIAAVFESLRGVGAISAEVIIR